MIQYLIYCWNWWANHSMDWVLSNPKYLVGFFILLAGWTFIYRLVEVWADVFIEED